MLMPLPRSPVLPLPLPRYRPDIDGLRALAVLLVVAFHAGVAGVPGGFVGVDVFFVISGYLITGLIAPEIASGGFSFAHFYERRVRRILPALLACVAACLIAGYCLLTPVEYRDLGRSALATLLFYANFHFAKRTGYFDGAAEEKPLLHMWSLAVEEQFYLVFPVVLWLIYRYAGRRLALALFALWGLSAADSVIHTWLDAAHAYFQPQARMWQLLTGSIVALGLVPAWRSAAAAEAAALAGLAAICAAALAYSAATPFPGSAALLPCLGAAALTHAGRTHETFVARLLALPPVLATGLASYSIYLWHWPLLVFTRLWIVRDFSGPERASLIVAALITGFASWRLIEQPFRKGGGKIDANIFDKSGALFPGRRIFAPAALTTAVLALAAIGIDRSRGLPQRLDPKVAALAEATFEWHEDEAACPQLTLEALARKDSCAAGLAGVPVTVMLIGDSHARALAPAFDAAAAKAGLGGGGLFTSGCPPFDGAVRAQSRDSRDCGQMTETMLRQVEGAPAVKTVIIAARWAYYANGTRFGMTGRTPFLWRDSETVTPSNAENAAVFARGLRRTVARLQAAGKTVILAGPVPEASADLPSALAREAMRGVNLALEPKLSDFDVRQKIVLAQLSEFGRGGVAVVYPHRVLCAAENICRVAQDGKSLYADDNHLSRAGAALLAPMLEAALRQAAAKVASP